VRVDRASASGLAEVALQGLHLGGVTDGRMSALITRLTRGDLAATASVARLTTSITSSHSPSRVVNMESVRFGSPESRTTRTASATSSPTLSPVPSGVIENATSMRPTVRAAGPFLVGAAPTRKVPPPAGARQRSVPGGCGPTKKRAWVVQHPPATGHESGDHASNTSTISPTTISSARRGPRARQRIRARHHPAAATHNRIDRRSA
jgi:hypothetical protein